MKNVRVDGDGELRCWNCGNKGLLAKRTFRSKMFIGVGALLTKKKLKCQTCGEYNDTGNAQPFAGPEGRKWRKAWEKEQERKSAAERAAEERSAALATQALMSQVAAAQSTGSSVEDGDDLDDVPPPPPPAAVGVPAGWQPDPSGRHEVRYWNGSGWTAHVADAGVQSTDPMA
jgi:hypothetical protein